MAHPSFIGLPAELRTQIYREYFKPAPDCYDREPSPADQIQPFELCNCYACIVEPLETALLQTSRQIHAEAAPVLYSEKVFHFSEQTSGNEDYPINVTSVCRDCDRYRWLHRLRRSDAEAIEDAKCTEMTDDGAHYSEIEKSGIVQFRDFLLKIGPTNRSLIRKVRLSIVTDQTTTFLRHPLRWKYTDADLKVEPLAVTGELMEEAFNLLAEAGGLRSLHISFHPTYSDLNPALMDSFYICRAFQDLFLPGRLKNSLCKIRSLTSQHPHTGISYSGIPGALSYAPRHNRAVGAVRRKMPAARAGFQIVKRKMED